MKTLFGDGAERRGEKRKEEEEEAEEKTSFSLKSRSTLYGGHHMQQSGASSRCPVIWWNEGASFDLRQTFPRPGHSLTYVTSS